MKAPVCLVGGDGPAPAAVLAALGDLVDVRAAGPGPVLTWRPGVMVLDGHEVAVPPLLVDLDLDRPMPPFLRQRGRRMRGLDDTLVVSAGEPLMHLAARVDAPATCRPADVVRALATGAIVVGPAWAERLGVDPELLDDPPTDERLAAARSTAAAFAARRFDPRSVAVELCARVGLGAGSVRFALCELHRGGLDRVDGRAARLVGTKGMGPWV